jgi:hypothetical protein
VLQFLALEGLLKNRQNPEDPASRDLYYPQVPALFVRLLLMASADYDRLKSMPVHVCILCLLKINTVVSCMLTAGLDFTGVARRKYFVEIVLSSEVVSEEDFKLHFKDLIHCEALPNNWPNQLPVNARWSASLTVGSILEGLQLTRLGELLLLLQPSPDHLSRFPADSMFVFGITGLRDAFDAHSGLVYTAHALPALLPNWIKSVCRFADVFDARFSFV